MILEDIFSAVKLAWQIAPFPILLLALIIAGFAWLWIEFQATRVLRATPGWRRPAPLMPGISIVSVGVIRVLWILIWVWLALFIVLALAIGLALSTVNVPRPVVDGVVSAGRAWNQGYRLLADRLPEEAPAWLRPVPVEPGDLVPPQAPPGSTEGASTPSQGSSTDAPPSASRPAAAMTSQPAASTAPLTPAATPTPAVTVRIVSNANVRSGPGTAASSLGIARAGRQYPVTGRNADSTWIRIDFAGAEGWVFAELAAIDGELDAAAVVPE